MSLVLHTGAQLAALDDLRSATPPAPCGRHYPIPHSLLRDTVVNGLKGRGLEVAEEQIALDREGARFFGVLRLKARGDTSAPVVGLRGSYDQSFAAALCAGSRVFVCDNLAFSGEVKVSRRNTRYGVRDLPGKVDGGLTRILGELKRISERFRVYRGTMLTEDTVNGILMNLVRTDALPGSKLRGVLSEFERPEFAEYGEPDTAWRLFNATTHVLRGQSAELLTSRTIHLHRELDAVCPELN